MEQIPKVDQAPQTDERIPSQEAQRLSLQAIFDELDASGAADFVIERDTSPPEERDWF